STGLNPERGGDPITTAPPIDPPITSSGHMARLNHPHRKSWCIPNNPTITTYTTTSITPIIAPPDQPMTTPASTPLTQSSTEPGIWLFCIGSSGVRRDGGERTPSKLTARFQVSVTDLIPPFFRRRPRFPRPSATPPSPPCDRPPPPHGTVKNRSGQLS